MPLYLNRIILFTPDVNLLKNFYQQHFGLQIVEETAGEWAVLKAGNCELALHKIGAGFETVETNITNTKLVFETDEDLMALREKLLMEGVALGEVKSFDGYPNLFCDGNDPEGNVFQLTGNR